MALLLGGACSSNTPNPVTKALCGAGEADCGGICVDSQSDGLNCGSCGTACSTGLKCSFGACVESCADGLTECGTSCVDPMTNLHHCGTCGVACAAGESCQSGVCGCQSGQDCENGIGGSAGGHVGVGGVAAGGTASGGATSAGGINSGGTTSAGGMTGSGGAVANCTNVAPPPPEDWPAATCELWASDTEECDEPWMVDDGLCNESCGRCDQMTGTGGGGSGSGGSGSGGAAEVTLPDLQGGENGFATRYWDCCKPSCSWSANSSSPVDSCDINDNNIGVDDNASNGCQGGPAFTCHNWAPWAKSDVLSYGFAAFNGAPCGTCYQVRFSGSSSRGTPTPGIDGKQMVVQVTNIGGIEGNQFDILIPGGGVGDFNGCSSQWGVDNSSLGAQYGGFRSACGQDAGCVRDMCENAFGDSPDLMAGCDWYIDWLQMADNPDIRFQQIDCPQEIRDRSGG